MSLIGIMWFDDDKNTSLIKKVRGGIECFQEKHNRLPELVTVNEKMLTAEMEVDGIPVRPQRETLIHHFFIMEEERDDEDGS